MLPVAGVALVGEVGAIQTICFAGDLPAGVALGVVGSTDACLHGALVDAKEGCGLKDAAQSSYASVGCDDGDVA